MSNPVTGEPSLVTSEHDWRRLISGEGDDFGDELELATGQVSPDSSATCADPSVLPDAVWLAGAPTSIGPRAAPVAAARPKDSNYPEAVDAQPRRGLQAATV